LHATVLYTQIYFQLCIVQLVGIKCVSIIMYQCYDIHATLNLQSPLLLQYL